MLSQFLSSSLLSTRLAWKGHKKFVDKSPYYYQCNWLIEYAGERASLKMCLSCFFLADNLMKKKMLVR